MKNIILFTLITISISVFSQEKSNISFDIGFSQTYKGFFYLFDGIVDAGLGYNKKVIGGLYGGLSFHLDYITRKNSPSKTMIYKPKINLHYVFKINERISITPLASLGYSFLKIENKEFIYSELQQGINPSAEIRISWTTDTRTDFYLYGRYDYIYLNKDNNFTQLEYFREVHLSSFGLGLKLKPRSNAK